MKNNRTPELNQDEMKTRSEAGTKPESEERPGHGTAEDGRRKAVKGTAREEGSLKEQPEKAAESEESTDAASPDGASSDRMPSEEDSSEKAPSGRLPSADMPEETASRENPSEGRKPGSRKLRIVVLVIELVALAAVCIILYMETRLERMQRADLSGEDLLARTEGSAEAGSTAGAEESTQPASAQVSASTQSAEEPDTGGTEPAVTANAPDDTYREIALFGVDSTEGELDQKTRSDAIMILCIDETTNDARIVSVYRDTLLNLGDGTYNKCNAAYAKGGAEQAIRMLNSNLDLDITDFVTIGFSGLTDVINALGGVEIDVDDRELQHINDYQLTMAQELGIDYTEVTHTGLQTLDGLQATAYCRVRYTYGWDYRRAARQREVMYQIIDKAKEASPATLAKMANDLFPEVYTSYDMTNLASDISRVYDITVEEESDPDAMQNGIPLADLRIQAVLGNSLGDCVVPRSLTDNVKWLHAYLFGDEDYQPSETVQEYSDYIDAFTKDAVPEEMTDADHT